MKNLDVPWKEIEAYLGAHAPDFKAVKLLPADKERFFKIQYEPGEIIMPKGAYSDYAAVHLKGQVFVYDRVPATKNELATSRECWRRPGRVRAFIKRRVMPLAGLLTRRFGLGKQQTQDLPVTVSVDLDSPAASEFENVEDWGPPQDDNFIKRTDFNGTERPFFERMMGVTSALLNQPRSYTLVAGFGAGQHHTCELYLIPRRILAELYKVSPAFREKHLQRFVKDELPRLLAENRLFRNTLYVEDILDPKELLSQLKGSGDLSESAASEHPLYDGKKLQRAEASKRLRACLGTPCRDWLKTLSPDTFNESHLAQLVSELNTLLKHADLFDKPNPDVPRPTENQIIKANRRQLEEAYSGVVKDTDPDQFLPAAPDELKELIDEVGPNQFQLIVCPAPNRPESKEIYAGPAEPDKPETAQEADGLYLIISGQVQIDRAVSRPGQPMLLNRLSRHGFFGLSCTEAGARHSASARAVTEAHLLKLDGRVVRDTIMLQFPAIAKKLRQERCRVQARDAQLGSGSRMPPATPPQDVANRLMVTTNLLLIDMDRCTRCDQCVAGCAAAHDDIPRFHRANPDLRFGKWEVAKACLHCTDAPCQRVCPVGAITFLSSGAVEIHRSRCIGCTNCVLACPFDVIEMAVATPGEPVGVENPKKPIATKCDLCLDENHEPPCVVSCPYGAAQRGHPREVFPAIKSWADAVYAR